MYSCLAGSPARYALRSNHNRRPFDQSRSSGIANIFFEEDSPLAVRVEPVFVNIKPARVLHVPFTDPL